MGHSGDGLCYTFQQYHRCCAGATTCYNQNFWSYHRVVCFPRITVCFICNRYFLYSVGCLYCILLRTYDFTPLFSSLVRSDCECIVYELTRCIGSFEPDCSFDSSGCRSTSFHNHSRWCGTLYQWDRSPHLAVERPDPARWLQPASPPTRDWEELLLPARSGVEYL